MKNKALYRKTFILILLFLLISILPRVNAKSNINIQKAFSEQLNQKGNPIKYTPIHATEFIYDFYQQRNFTPVWINENGLLPAGKELFDLLNNADKQGLLPEEYHLSSLNGLWLKLGNIQDNTKNTNIFLKWIYY